MSLAVQRSFARPSRAYRSSLPVCFFFLPLCCHLHNSRESDVSAWACVVVCVKCSSCVLILLVLRMSDVGRYNHDMYWQLCLQMNFLQTEDKVKQWLTWQSKTHQQRGSKAYQGQTLLHHLPPPRPHLQGQKAHVHHALVTSLFSIDSLATSCCWQVQHAVFNKS